MNDRILEEIGLTRNEIIVYKTLLQLGQTTTGPLTRKARIHISRVYDSLNSLINKGLSSFVIKSNRKYFQAQNPESIIGFIEEKKQEVKKIIPELKSLQEQEKEKQEANVFEGYKGIKSIFENSLKELKKGNEYYVFGARSGEDISPETWGPFFENFSKRREKEKIKLKIIFNKDLKGSKTAENYKKLKFTEVRFMDQKTLAGINIHKDKVAIIVWKENPYAFVIESREVSDSFKEYFKAMWKIAKS